MLESLEHSWSLSAVVCWLWFLSFFFLFFFISVTFFKMPVAYEFLSFRICKSYSYLKEIA